MAQDTFVRANSATSNRKLSYEYYKAKSSKLNPHQAAAQIQSHIRGKLARNYYNARKCRGNESLTKIVEHQGSTHQCVRLHTC